MNTATTATDRHDPTQSQNAAHEGLADFFRYHGFWAPGVRLFRRLSFPAKAAWVALTLVVPIAGVLATFAVPELDSIAFSAKE